MALTGPGLSDEYSRESYEGYDLIFRVTPYPEVGRKILPDEYQLCSTVGKLPKMIRSLAAANNPLCLIGQAKLA